MVTTVAERFGRGRFVAVSRPERPHRHVGGMVGGSCLGAWAVGKRILTQAQSAVTETF